MVFHKNIVSKGSVTRPAFFIDGIAVALIFALVFIGLLFVMSATVQYDQLFSAFFKKQLIAICFGFVLYFLFSCLDFRVILQLGYLLYGPLLTLLFFTLLAGVKVMGARRWIGIGFLRFQPSEFVRLLFPACATHYLYATHNLAAQKFTTFLPLLFLLAASFLFVLKQPDLGTALLFGVSGAAFLWIAGLSTRFFLIAGLVGALMIPIGWKFLKPYQKQRIMVFLGEGEVHKERYQLEQSLIAIGSGKLMGKGFLKGTQNKFLFLPEGRTDFIFAVIAEEGGFFVAGAVLLLFLLLFARLIYLISLIQTHNAQLLAIGLLLPLIVATVINVGMVMGLLPIVGVPLPLVSYGMSHMLVALSSLGIIQGCIAQAA